MFQKKNIIAYRSCQYGRVTSLLTDTSYGMNVPLREFSQTVSNSLIMVGTITSSPTHDQLYPLHSPRDAPSIAV